MEVTKTKFVEMKPNEMFATPESKEALRDYLSQFSGSEAVIAQTCAFMMYNYLVTNYTLTKK
jgi:hypothetical protein